MSVIITLRPSAEGACFRRASRRRNGILSFSRLSSLSRATSAVDVEVDGPAEGEGPLAVVNSTRRAERRMVENWLSFSACDMQKGRSRSVSHWGTSQRYAHGIVTRHARADKPFLWCHWWWEILALHVSICLGAVKFYRTKSSVIHGNLNSDIPVITKEISPRPSYTDGNWSNISPTVVSQTDHDVSEAIVCSRYMRLQEKRCCAHLPKLVRTQWLWGSRWSSPRRTSSGFSNIQIFLDLRDWLCLRRALQGMESMYF